MAGIIVITTVGDEEQANLLARELVGRRHAACVNVLTGVRSTYRWRGKICRDSEFMLVVKTMAEEYDALVETIHELHNYDLPEVLAFEIGRGDPRFLEWLGASLDKDATFDDDDGDFPDIDSL